MFGKKQPSAQEQQDNQQPKTVADKLDNLKNEGSNPLTQMPQPRKQEVGQQAAKPQAKTQKSKAKVLDDILIYTDSKLETSSYKEARAEVFEILLEKVNLNALSGLPKEQQVSEINSAVDKILEDIVSPLNAAQVDLIRKQTLNDVIGFGPLEALIHDPEVSDIMVNTAKRVFVEKSGKIKLTDITFNSESHLLNVIQKIVSLVGRRVDESSPMVDARMPDGSRFNAIIPPLALDGSLVSIRKFKQNKFGLEDYVNFKSISPQMKEFLEVIGACRLNVMISGGTGSGKTTLLNALSGCIEESERVVTIEDAAELQLLQPHVLRLETRPPNMEGTGEITQRALVKNALRMRPDRIILGEIRGDEVIDMLQAMNTGHDGSMATIHANNPRECLTRIENLIGLSGATLPAEAMRRQIASAIHIIVQVARMRDGGRRIVAISEIVGIEGDIITMQDLFVFKPGPMGEDGKLTGEFESTNIRPRFHEQAKYFGLDEKLDNAIGFNNMQPPVGFNSGA